jgi:hypothetical protein
VADGVLVLVGTMKGAFLFRSIGARGAGTEGPIAGIGFHDSATVRWTPT